MHNARIISLNSASVIYALVEFGLKYLETF